MTVIIYGTDQGEDLGSGSYLEDLIIYALGGDDRLFGNNFSPLLQDILFGGAGNDIIYDYQGDDLAYGGVGRDTFRPGLGNDLYDGGGGIDTFAAYDSSGDWNIDLIARTATTSDAPGDTDTLKRIEIIQTGFGTDLIYGSNNAETIETGSGADTVYGRGGDDVIDGGRHADMLFGNAGNDTLLGGDSDSAADILHGGAGNDYLNGGSGNDELYGDDGDDLLYDGGSYDDILDGGDGFDTADYSDGTATVDLMAGTAWRSGTGEMDQLISIEAVIAGAGWDNLTGDDNSNRFNAGGGNDTLNGNGATDELYGEKGDDAIDGGADKDFLIGGRGRDILTGGDGSDAFIYTALNEVRDTITDFSSTGAGNNDRFEFLGTAFGGLAPGNITADQFQSSNAAVAKTADVRFFYEEDTQKLRYDPDGDGAEAAIIVAILQPGATVIVNDILII